MDQNLLAILLRTLTYVGAIGAAGSVLFALSLPRIAESARAALRTQIIAGCCLLLLVEPLRYLVFQLQIAEGDWSIAFGPDLRWMGMQTPIGRASAVRLCAALIMLAVGLRSRRVALVAAVILIGSFLLEGHTASGGARIALAALLFIHLAAATWWIGALYPLMALTRNADPATVCAGVEAFGARAVPIVIGLLAAGALLLVFLTGGELRLDSAYQQRFIAKLVLVALLLSIAAWNKLRLTPLLSRDFQSGAARLRASIVLEMGAALAILAATAWDHEHRPGHVILALLSRSLDEGMRRPAASAWT